MQLKIVFISILMITLLHTGCTGKNNVVTPAKGTPSPYLVSFEKKFSYSADQLKNKYGIISEHIKNGFSAYRLTYKTNNIDGKQVIASGAVLVPDVKQPLPLMNYNHGTYFLSNEKSAPGYLSQYNSEVMMGGLFSAMGYVIVMPDYIGYGASKDLKHPYCAYNFIAATCIDMLRATREFCDSQKIMLNNKNFFTGWSEGGGVALAVVKNIEEKFPNEFNITAVAPMAGAYYSSGFAEYVLNNKDDFPYINSYAWVLQTYNWLYKINKPLTYYFNEPYASRLEKNAEATIPLKPDVLFTSTFKKDYANGAASALQKALEENDLWNWKPKSKIVLCHGERDMYVPYFNSKKTYEAMKAKGANVTLAAYSGRGHSNCMPQYIETIYSTFEKLQ